MELDCKWPSMKVLQRTVQILTGWTQNGKRYSFFETEMTRLFPLNF